MVHEAFSIDARHEDLAHVAHVEHAAGVAHGVVLVDDGRVLNGHDESAEGLHQRPQGYMFFV